ncbi:predicted protein [Sclerotinia sclerotiorum 1980 UF-70]|uniref:Uncharacterized protein n=1 Tax=Sclerotinia sclerotiorum (strain ATCC 18683 / 1980 / Ss-1) TaxID=665079 RepID=A7F8A4_SCLS1|nr:predicted protein [Sclerotinia sclerotiorum 1980 UF-70]EDN98975.1 predicted protein [Sclerotinia sclerotiorum 1980 UF-70]
MTFLASLEISSKAPILGQPCCVETCNWHIPTGATSASIMCRRWEYSYMAEHPSKIYRARGRRTPMTRRAMLEAQPRRRGSPKDPLSYTLNCSKFNVGN